MYGKEFKIRKITCFLLGHEYDGACKYIIYSLYTYTVMFEDKRQTVNIFIQVLPSDLLEGFK